MPCPITALKNCSDSSETAGLHDLELQPEAAQHLSGYLQTAYENRDKFFGNARFVRQTVEAIVTKQNLRMAAMNKEQRTRKACNRYYSRMYLNYRRSKK
jgi:hypothetical protein